MCNVNDPRISHAYIAMTEDEPINWLILGYKDTRDIISLYATGINGLSEFRNNLTNEILFGYVRIEDKFISITYIPDSISGVRRARALVHSRTIANILKISHAQITASNLSDLSDTNIHTRLKLGGHQAKKVRPRSTLPSSFYEDAMSDRMSSTPTPTPSTPTSVASSSFTNDYSLLNHHHHHFTTDDHTFINSPSVTDKDPDTRLQEQTELMLQYQLSKKKELEEARFRQSQYEQREEKFINKSFNENELLKRKEIPKWQQELQQRKLKKQQQQQQPPSIKPILISNEEKSFHKEEKKTLKDSSSTLIESQTDKKTCRTIVMTGFMSVQTNTCQFWKRRYFIIDTHGLVFFKDEMQKEAMTIIPYSNIKRVGRIDEDEETYVPNAYVIHNKQGDSYQILADDKKTGKQIYTTLNQGLISYSSIE
ncbi:uncharacterized protein BX663DRAFT_435409 [Cokeromyces recurvatus]|uniref:uncharacterized protein n=1 Tax=Cokeromyces recurvatus TaxID=90255 RepID=UPI00221EEB6E|nr:uncharacterized protein BX663DRAFT_435409 [Cokeromyces recurvatus]KAI7902435.1 hypothetical protein BX663DRAFT_435409 [Cokeromyces recurvatus]